MEFDKAGDSEVGTRSGRVYYVIAGKFAFDSEVDRESLKGLSEEWHVILRENSEMIRIISSLRNKNNSRFLVNQEGTLYILSPFQSNR